MDALYVRSITRIAFWQTEPQSPFPSVQSTFCIPRRHCIPRSQEGLHQGNFLERTKNLGLLCVGQNNVFFSRVNSYIIILVSKRFKWTPVIGSVSGTISYTSLYPGIYNGLASTMGPTPSRRLILSFPMLLTSSIILTRTLEVGFLGRNTLLKNQNANRTKFSPSLTIC